MGNVQCGLQNTFISEDEYTDDGSSSIGISGRMGAGACLVSSQQQGDFLTVHLQEAQALCLLEQEDVTQALVKQGDELIRREGDARLRLASTFGRVEKIDHEILSMSVITSSRNHNAASDRVAVVDANTDNASTCSSVPSVSSSSMFRNSSIITFSSTNAVLAGVPNTIHQNTPRTSSFAHSESGFSAMTQQVRNSVKSNIRRQRYNAHQQQPISENAITSLEEDNKKRESSSSSPKAPSSSSKLQLRAAGCMLPLQMMVKDTIMDKQKIHGIPLRYMTVLHLRLRAKCTDFFKQHLATLLPHCAMARAITEGAAGFMDHHHSDDAGLYTTPHRRLSPHRRSLSPPPHLARSHSGSTDSSSTPPTSVCFGGEGPQSLPIQLLVTDSSFLDLAVTGSLGLVDRRRKMPRDEFGTTRKFIEPPEHYIVLLNRRSGVPLAVCALKADSMNAPVVRIYATKRRFTGQRPAATTRKLGLCWSDSFPLYTWAEIVTKGQYPDHAHYSIFMASGNDAIFEEAPCYRAMSTSAGSPEIRVMGRTGKEHAYTGCAILSLDRDEDAVHDNELFFRLSISKGVDPALFICFTAFMDETMEKTMMLQCQSAAVTSQRAISQARRQSLAF
jgi:hypothetical protein